MLSAGFVLVGGQSSRFGANKALVDIDGAPMALRVAEKVRQAAGSVTLVGEPDRYASLDYPVIPDRMVGFGPVAGIAAALEHTVAKWNLIVACDMPSLRVDFLRFLLQRAQACGRDALAPISPDGREQPLCAVYSKDLAGAFDNAVAQDERKITAALRGLSVHYLMPPEYKHIDPSGEVFLNVNRPQDLQRAR